MLISFDSTGDCDALARTLAGMAAAAEVGLAMVLACDGNGFVPQNLDPILRAFGKPLIGGLFPEIIVGRDRYTRGTIVAGLDCEATVATLTDISDNATDFPRCVEAAAGTSYPRGTLLMFSDGRGQRINALIDALFNTFGLDIDYLGGGAGSFDPERRPCVLSNQGLLMDAAALALTDIAAGVGVAHGWTPIAGPWKVTEADRNTIVSLDWRPAFDVYREAVETHAGQRFQANDFFDLAKAYPFGIARLDNEMVVRTAHAEEGSRLVCVGEVPQGTYLHVLHGGAEGLVRAAGKARDIAFSSYRGKRAARAMVLIDCLSRALFLGEGFPAEIGAVQSGLPLIGALTLGEIANSRRDYLEFYNKTAVVGLLDA